MLRVKIFSNSTHGGDIPGLEREINTWLDATQPTIRQMTQSGAGDHVTVAFLYERRRREDQAHLANAEVPSAFERDLEDTELDPVEDEPTILPEVELPY
jgi:hypothetical protein